jgi:hypothetical protein
MTCAKVFSAALESRTVVKISWARRNRSESRFERLILGDGCGGGRCGESDGGDGRGLT